jgi:hypothetical protein
VEDAIRAKDTIVVPMLKRAGAILSPAFQRRCVLDSAFSGNIEELDLMFRTGAVLTVSNYDRVFNISSP